MKKYQQGLYSKQASERYIKELAAKTNTSPEEFIAFLKANRDTTLDKLYLIPGEENREALLSLLDRAKLPPDATLENIVTLVGTNMDLVDDPREAMKLNNAMAVLISIQMDLEEKTEEEITGVRRVQHTRPARRELTPTQEAKRTADNAFLLQTGLGEVEQEQLVGLVKLEDYPHHFQSRMAELVDNRGELHNFGDLLDQLKLLERAEPDSAPQLRKLAAGMAKEMGMKHLYQCYLDDGAQAQKGGSVQK